MKRESGSMLDDMEDPTSYLYSPHNETPTQAKRRAAHLAGQWKLLRARAATLGIKLPLRHPK
jgi:hypothetical protein